MKLLRILFILSIPLFYGTSFAQDLPTWYPLPLPPEETPEYFVIQEIEVDPLDPATFYVGADTYGAWKSLDGGSQWTLISKGLTEGDVVSLSAGVVNNKTTLYLATASRRVGHTDYASVWRSQDSGDWEDLGPAIGFYGTFPYVKAVPNNGNRVYVSIYNPATLLRSTNGGGSFQEILNGAWAFDLCETTPQTLYAINSNGIQVSTDGGDHWNKRVGGLPEDYDFRFIAVHPTNPDIAVIVGRRNYPQVIFQTLDGGNTWNEAANLWDIERDQVTAIGAIEFSRSDPTTAYVLIQSRNGYSGSPDHIFCSTDTGASWQEVETTSLGNRIPRSFAVATHSSMQPGELFVAKGDGGIYRSLDRGKNWQQLSREGLQTYLETDFTLHPTADHSVALLRQVPYQVFYQRGVRYFSTTGGATWQEQTLPGGLKDVTYHPTDPNTLLAITNAQVAGASRVYQSTNGGRSWNPYGQLASSDPGFKIRYAPSNPDIVYAVLGWDSGSSQSLWRSEDGGKTFGVRCGWNQPNAFTALDGFAVAPSDPNRLWSGGSSIIGSTGGVKVSRDGGLTFYGTRLNNQCYDFAIHPDQVDTVYAACHDEAVLGTAKLGGIFKTTDSLWFERMPEEGLEEEHLFDRVWLDPSNPDILYAKSTRNIYRWDGGSAWEKFLSADVPEAGRTLAGAEMFLAGRRLAYVSLRDYGSYAADFDGGCLPFQVPFDMNGDCLFDIADLFTLSTYWQSNLVEYDFNLDGLVDSGDWYILEKEWK